MIFDSPMDVGLVVLIALILFGGKKIPELIRNSRNGGGGDSRGSPQHPIPVTGPIETKRNRQTKKTDEA